MVRGHPFQNPQSEIPWYAPDEIAMTYVTFGRQVFH